MSLLNGGFPTTPATLDDFIQECVDRITDDEWRILAQLPPVKHVTELLSVVAEIRSAATQELPTDHPLTGVPA